VAAEGGSQQQTPGEIRASKVAALGADLHQRRVDWFERYLRELHDRHQGNDEGEVASYIPELTRSDPSTFGIAVHSTDDQLNGAGDVNEQFTIQSISKVLVYGLALETWGRERVLQRVGVEPSGEQFNAIVLDESSNRPFNPMVNAGAIATTDLIEGDGPEDRLAKVLETYRRYLGRDVEIDEEVYRSEAATGHRNRAIAYLKLSRGIVSEKVEETIELYIKQCSVRVSAVDLAQIAATLANAGVNPHTGEVALERQYVRDVLSVTLTCGMYDYSGEWAYWVGLPAKSGVGGGIMAVLPGVGGLGVYSPRLDRFGNSVRGIQVCEDISRELGVHLFDPARPWLTESRLLEIPVDEGVGP
jgi:glutaminase